MFQLFVNTDDEGNITESYYGENIIATENFDFFFLVEPEVAEDAVNHKVEIAGLKPQLVSKDV